MTGWYCLGIHLQIATSYLDQIQKNYGGDAERCKVKVIGVSLCNDENPTWRKLAPGSVKAVQNLKANHEGW